MRRPRQSLQDLDLRRRACVDFVECRAEAPRRRPETFERRHRPCAQCECLRSGRPCGRIDEDVVELRLRPLGSTQLEHAARRVQPPFAGRFSLIRRREPRGGVPQLGGRVGRATRSGSARGVVELLRDRGVGTVGREREMPPLFLDVVDGCCDAGVESGALCRIKPRIGRRPEQRVSQEHALAVECDDACRFGQPQLVEGTWSEQGRHRGDRRATQHRRHLDDLDGRAESVEAIADDAQQRVGYRQRPVGGRAAVHPCACEVQCEHRVSACHLVQLLHIAWRQCVANAFAHDRVDLARVECGDLLLDDSHACVVVDVVEDAVLAGGTRCDEETHPLGAEPSHHESQDTPRRLVHPLRVVDADHDRALARQVLQQPEGRHGDGPRRQFETVGLGAQQRYLQGVTLRLRQFAEVVVGDIDEQVRERRERELCLGIDRATAVDAEPSFLRESNAFVPQRRLADTGLAGEHQRRGATADRVDEDAHCLGLVDTTDDGGVAHVVSLTGSLTRRTSPPVAPRRSLPSCGQDVDSSLASTTNRSSPRVASMSIRRPRPHRTSTVQPAASSDRSTASCNASSVIKTDGSTGGTLTRSGGRSE